MELIADKMPKPPYYAVIFTSTMTENNGGYEAMAQQMIELSAQQPGFLGIESAREELGITVSYWRELADIRAWKQQSEHLAAQKLGRGQWYKDFTVRIARVEKSYSM